MPFFAWVVTHASFNQKHSLSICYVADENAHNHNGVKLSSDTVAVYTPYLARQEGPVSAWFTAIGMAFRHQTLNVGVDYFRYPKPSAEKLKL